MLCCVLSLDGGQMEKPTFSSKFLRGLPTRVVHVSIGSPGPGFVCLAKTVPGVRDSEGAIHLCRDLDPICSPVVRRGRRHTRPGLRRGHRSHRHAVLLVVNSISDEHSRHSVLLPAEEREVKLPQVLETRGRKNNLHRARLPALTGAVVQDGHPRLDRMHKHFRIRHWLSMM